ncbi:diguanylate cyclase (GGDEF)-like protein/PAS domain S-box-containing protein [Pseudomonas sp. TE3786]
MPRLFTHQRAPGDSLATTLPNSVKGALVVLVVMMLGLLFWQLYQELNQGEETRQKREQEYGQQLAEHMGLSVEMRAHAALALLTQTAPQPPAADKSQPLLDSMRGIFPALSSLVWLDRDGRVLADTQPDSHDQAFISSLFQRHQNQPYQYLFNPDGDGQIYAFLPKGKGDGFWVLRMGLTHLRRSIREFYRSDHRWQLEDRLSQQVIATQPAEADEHVRPVSAFERANTVQVVALPGTELMVRSVLDKHRAWTDQLSAVTGKFLLFMACALLTLLALFRLLREQSRLRDMTTASRRELRDAATALGAIEERVIVTDVRGHVRYLNPQAAQLFGLSGADARGRHLLDLLPSLDPLLMQDSEPHDDFSPVWIELDQHQQQRVFSVTRRLFKDGKEHSQPGHVWVLRDATEQQQALHILEDTRRRYQDIFEGSGVAHCVLDLADLRSYLHVHDIETLDQFDHWLQMHPQLHDELIQHLHITEINQVAQQLLGVESTQELWNHLVDVGPITPENVRYQLIGAVLSKQRQIELESQIVTPQGHERHLWLVLRLPEQNDDFHAVTVSMNDITSRKRIELSLIERERFWSDVVRAVPDTLYVHDMTNRRVLFSNNRLGQQLGYSGKELREMAGHFWEVVLHPDDAEQYARMRTLQQVVSDGQLLQCHLRWRHRDGSWHWFDIREQALSRTADGRVHRLIGVAKDVTEQIEASELLRNNERRYRLLAENISDVIFTTNDSLQLDYVSPSAMAMFGYSPEWIIANGFHPLAANPNQLSDVDQLLIRVRGALNDPQKLRELRQQLATRLYIVDCVRADGHKLPTELRMTLMWDQDGRFEGLLGVGRNISQQRRAEKDLRMAATVFEHSTAAILVTDPAGYIVQVNEAFSRVSGYSSPQVLDQQPGMLMADRQQTSHQAYILSQLAQNGSWEGEVWLKRRNQENFPAWVGITAVHDDEGDLVSYVSFFSDISERKASEQRIHRLAYYDALTNLPNRTLFQDRLHTALQHAERHLEWVVLMFLDLDRFKPINDSLGHAAGDRMLKDVAQRLAACVEVEDTVARMGGDEFTLLLQARDTRDGALTRAIHVAEQILASLAQPFILEGREFFVTASIGIALSPQDGEELSQLMKNADTAMYHAKERGKNNFQFYQAAMNATALERLELESDLRHALDQQQFVLYYQPQFSANGQRLIGAEALLRWQHPRRGLIAPNEFIPVLEELGLVVDVGDWVLVEACRQMNAWQAAGVRVPKVSVNLSARQFAEGQLGQRIANILHSSGLSPSSLELELTESILMHDVEETMQVLKGFKQLGLSIAVDDFGTGYSSLNYLKQFPIDVLKIDRSFVDGLPSGEQDAQIARAIIAMAHSLNLAVIAEGVETQEQLDFLREHGCDEVQGYLLGKPMTAHQLAAQFSGNALFMLS